MSERLYRTSSQQGLDADDTHDSAEPEGRELGWPGRRSRTSALVGKRIDRDAVGSAAPGRYTRTLLEAAARRSGMPLPAPLRGELERELRTDLGEVRLHLDSDSQAAATALGANAYTIGQDVHFGAGMFAPESLAGRRLIAHEVAHTVQQGHAEPADLAIGDVSSPQDLHEVEAASFAETFTTQQGDREGSEAASPSDQGLSASPPLAARSVPGPVISRSEKEWGGELTDHPTPLTIPLDDIKLFDDELYRRQWDVLKPQFVPLARTTVLVDGVPVTFAADFTAEAKSGVLAFYGPGKISDIAVDVMPSKLSAAEKAALALPTPPPIKLVILARAAHDARGRLSVPAFAGAYVAASASLEAKVEVASDVLEAGVFAGLTGSVHAEAETEPEVEVTFSLENGKAVLRSAELKADARLHWEASLDAHAGAFVKLQFPKLPVVDGVFKALSDLPVVGWLVPDLSKLEWRKEWRKDWKLWAPKGGHSWKLHEMFTVGGTSPGASSTMAIGNKSGFDMTSLLAELVGSQAEEKNPDPDDQPTKDQKSGAGPGLMLDARDRALATLLVLRRTLAREEKWNVGALTQAGGGSSSSGSPTLSVQSGPSVPPGAVSPDELEARSKRLSEADASATVLETKLDELRPVEARPEGTVRNRVKAGYDGIADYAGKLEKRVDEDERPGEGAGPGDDASRAALVKEIESVEWAFGQALAVCEKEVFWTRDQVTGCGSNPELAAYKALVAKRGQTVDQLRKDFDRLEEHIDQERETAMHGDHAAGLASFTKINADLRGSHFDAQSRAGDRPKGDWDQDFAMVEKGKLMLIPEYRNGDVGRGRDKIRPELYGRSYRPTTKKWKRKTLENKHQLRKNPDTAAEEWFWKGPQVPEGKWFLVDDSTEKPTIGHDDPKVSEHWNAQGNGFTQKERADFYNGGQSDADRDAKLHLQPYKYNSSEGSEDKVSYTGEVRKTFRGSGKGGS